jgi:hypothetical protein
MMKIQIVERLLLVYQKAANIMGNIDGTVAIAREKDSSKTLEQFHLVT